MKNKNLILITLIVVIALVIGYLIGNIKISKSSSPINVNQNVNVNTEPTKDKININKATQKELESLYNIGEVKAQRIIENRPYNSIWELEDIIGEKTFENIRDKLGV